jgi:hypothetical protein
MHYFFSDFRRPWHISLHLLFTFFCVRVKIQIRFRHNMEPATLAPTIACGASEPQPSAASSKHNGQRHLRLVWAQPDGGMNGTHHHQQHECVIFMMGKFFVDELPHLSCCLP